MKLNCPNIAFRCFDDITSKVSMPRNLNNTTVICLGCENVEDELIDKYAEILLNAGCRSFVFYGNDEPNWHYRFDLMDIRLRGDVEDVALTSTLEDLNDLPDEFLISEADVKIYACDYEMVRRSYQIIIDAGCGNAVRYVGQDSMNFEKGCIYRVLSVEKGWYRIMTDCDEDYLFPPELFEEVEE